MSFKITALPGSHFEHLFDLPAAELAKVHATRIVASKNPGFPCRISLADAEIGEPVLLVHYEHQTANSPFRASHAVYVRPHAIPARPQIDEVPVMLRSRALSLRAFGTDGMLLAADLADGKNLESSIETMFREAAVDYIHIHFAKPGCYAARADRAPAI